MGKPRFFNGFHEFCKFAVKLTKCCLGVPRESQNGGPGHPKRPIGPTNEPPELQIEAQERPDGPSERPNGCPNGPWQPNLLLQVLPKANLSASGSLRDRFWRPRGSYLGGSSINFKQTISFHTIPCTPFHFIAAESKT